jgi:four helix bundle protein
MKEILREKSYAFALRIVNLSEYLHKEKHESVLSRKVLDSGTNIGLFIEEGKQGVDTEDFRARYAVANKEAFKTNFLLRLLRDGNFINERLARSLLDDCEELQKMLISTLKTTRQKDIS